MKIQTFFLASFLLLLTSLSFAQTITISGTVKNEAGKVLSSAMVEVKSTSTVLKVDSAGGFSVGVNPKAKLLVSCSGYEDKQVNVNNNKNLLVILIAKAGTNINNNQFTNDLTERQGRNTSVIYGYNSGTNGGTRIALAPVFGSTEATRGSRYLFDEWADGTVVSVKDSVIKNQNYHFNYDKINGTILLSEDKTNVIEIDKDQLKAFTLRKEGGSFKTFELVPEIDKLHFVEVLSNGGKYKIYKQLNTKFVKNDYRNDGLTSVGNNYDQYVDENAYYVMDVKSKQLHKTTLKKKALKEVFATDATKVNSYLITHTDDINDSYLTNLGNYLNQ